MSELVVGNVILKLILVLASAKFAGLLAEKIKQPAVLGELLAGVALGPSIFGIIHPGQEVALSFLAEIGIILLLFDVGLESDVKQLVKAGIPSSMVALIGIIASFGVGALYAYSAGLEKLVAFFIGAALTATSVGVTVRLFQDTNTVKSEEAKLILDAAVIDDILGLIILSVLVGIITAGSVSVLAIGKTAAIAILFLGISIGLGIYLAPIGIRLIRTLELKHSIVISGFVLALSLAYIADLIGLATIVGAFAAGLILAKTHSREDIEKRIRGVTNLFTPIFFVMAGSFLDIWSLFDKGALRFVLALSAIAFLGKLVSGLGVFRNTANRLVVGLGMVPRGEVGLIFASIGLGAGILSAPLYSQLIVIIMITTLAGPVLMKLFMKK